MTSRERVKAVIDGKIPDRVPIDIGASLLTGMHVDEYLELARYLGLDCELPKVYDQYQMLARVEGPIRDWLHSDVIGVENPRTTWNYSNKNWKQWSTQNGNRVLVPGEFDTRETADGMLVLYDADGNAVARMPKGGLYFDKLFPEDAIDLMADIEFTDPKKYKSSIPLYTKEDLQIIKTRAKFYHDNTSLSVMGEFIKGNLATSGAFAGHTFTQWMCVAALEPEYAFTLVRACAERVIENLELYLEAVGDNIDTIFVSSSDFGTQNASFYSPDTFSELYVPNYKLINDYIHSHSKAKVIFHSCGSIRELIPGFIEAGVDILNPVQTSAAGMNPGELKKEFGKQLVFWGGGVDTQQTLPNGTPAEVAQQVRERIDIFGKDGGFVFTPIHNTQYGVPPQNIEAMIRAVLEHGNY